MSFEMMCFLMVIVMGIVIAIYGAIKVNGGVQPKMAAKQGSNRKEDVKEKWEFWKNIFCVWRAPQHHHRANKSGSLETHLL